MNELEAEKIVNVRNIPTERTPKRLKAIKLLSPMVGLAAVFAMFWAADSPRQTDGVMVAMAISVLVILASMAAWLFATVVQWWNHG